MYMERETAVEAGVTLVAVAVFVAVVILGGEVSAAGLTESGAYAVVGAIVAFILVMAGAGYYLSTKQD
ncbi:hypothetical protein J2754_000470 [Halarchaeum solikamskense]|uniref:DUF7472 family protein n=1 Tax=Halarchaeum nitratireducens TaxID=489913 RepID=UPI001B3A884C|nr:hypothetical protein [Halarchaeum solikamskense]MBP2250173.1 hypothetical protein [Halarchaeum solikamskense]